MYDLAENPDASSQDFIRYHPQDHPFFPLVEHEKNIRLCVSYGHGFIALTSRKLAGSQWSTAPGEALRVVAFNDRVERARGTSIASQVQNPNLCFLGSCLTNKSSQVPSQFHP